MGAVANDLMFLLSFAALSMLLIAWTVSRAFRPVAQILTALDVIQRGDYSARLSEQHLPELQQIARKLNHMAQQLESQEQENRALRSRALARPGGGTQGSGAGACTTSWARRSVRSRRSPFPSGNARRAKRTRANEPLTITSICDGMHSAVRNMSKRLRPVVLDELGLVTALRRAVEEWNEHHPGVSCTLEIDGELGELDEQLRIQIYRIVQEAADQRCPPRAWRHSSA
jgi:two-component system sensor histidine kinase UhpB